MAVDVPTLRAFATPRIAGHDTEKVTKTGSSSKLHMCVFGDRTLLLKKIFAENIEKVW